MSRACARRKARRSSPITCRRRSDVLRRASRSGRRHRLRDVEHAGIRRRRQHLQRGVRRDAQSMEHVALGGGLVGRRRGRRWRPAWRGSRTAPTWAAPCAIPRASAASSACGRASAASRGRRRRTSIRTLSAAGTDGAQRRGHGAAARRDAAARTAARSVVAAAARKVLSRRRRARAGGRSASPGRPISASRRSTHEVAAITRKAARALRRSRRDRRGGASGFFRGARMFPCAARARFRAETGASPAARIPTNSSRR